MHDPSFLAAEIHAPIPMYSRWKSRSAHKGIKRPLVRRRTNTDPAQRAAGDERRIADERVRGGVGRRDHRRSPQRHRRGRREGGIQRRDEGVRVTLAILRILRQELHQHRLDRRRHRDRVVAFVNRRRRLGAVLGEQQRRLDRVT